MSNFIVGLTGGIGSGKSTVASHFGGLGITIVDADAVARDAVAPGTAAFAAIQGHFGETIIQRSGELDRQQLRELVFNDAAKKQWLNDLLHPLIRRDMLIQAQQAQSPYCIIEIPLLVENNLQHLVQRVLVVDCPEALQVKRAVARDQSSTQQIQQIMASQSSRATRLASADDVIDNSHPKSSLIEQVTVLHARYLLQSQHSQSKLEGELGN